MSERPGRDPFQDLRRALAAGPEPIGEAGGGGDPVELRLDDHRRERTGDPEIVFGRHKSPDQVITALRRLVDINGRAIATRCDATTISAVRSLQDLGPDDAADFEVDDAAGLIIASRPGSEPPPPRGLVGILAAGSSDRTVVREVSAVLHESGIGVAAYSDVGVAGIHRLIAPLERLSRDGVDVLIVAAGMDGALPSVVAGLVDVPVIGVPTSTGYGFGGDGVGALMTMLQTCAPGLTVVNIDNGVGAALSAARIVRRSIHPAG